MDEWKPIACFGFLRRQELDAPAGMAWESPWGQLAYFERGSVPVARRSGHKFELYGMPKAEAERG